MNNSTLGCWWVVIAKSLENKGIPRFSFRFESTSVYNIIILSRTRMRKGIKNTQWSTFACFTLHTFATTCVQYVRPDIVDTWMGDSSERLVGRVYTHFPDEFMTNQMDLVQFEF